MPGHSSIKFLTFVNLLEGLEIGQLKGIGIVSENRTPICNNEGGAGAGQELNTYDCQISEHFVVFQMYRSGRSEYLAAQYEASSKTG
jgi:hypothetical protein